MNPDTLRAAVLLTVVAIGLSTLTTRATAADTPPKPVVASRIIAQSDGTRASVATVTLSASLSDAWRAFTTEAGWKSWAVPFAKLEMRVGGLIETSYNPQARAGDPNNIQSTILAYIPERMLAFQATRAPPGFQNAQLLPEIFTVVEFESLGPTHTSVRLWSVGYRNGAAYDQLLGFFNAGNAWTLGQLATRFETGPVDWSKVSAPSK